MNSNGVREPLVFFVGVILLGAGLFIFSNMVTVSSTWHNWGFATVGNVNFTNGLIIIPLIVGIIAMFYNPKMLWPKIVAILGVVFLLLTIIMSIRFDFRRTSLFNYILIVVMVGGGAGLVLRGLFRRR